MVCVLDYYMKRLSVKKKTILLTFRAPV
uniref:Uncharacterized protein n=1 Tax=Rhizophora mucronata TaxID=61149 RepID=A0A2P2Q258_RHIMU